MAMKKLKKERKRNKKELDVFFCSSCIAFLMVAFGFLLEHYLSHKLPRDLPFIH